MCNPSQPGQHFCTRRYILKEGIRQETAATVTLPTTHRIHVSPATYQRVVAERGSFFISAADLAGSIDPSTYAGFPAVTLPTAHRIHVSPATYNRVVSERGGFFITAADLAASISPSRFAGPPNTMPPSITPDDWQAAWPPTPAAAAFSSNPVDEYSVPQQDNSMDFSSVDLADIDADIDQLLDFDFSVLQGLSNPGSELAGQTSPQMDLVAAMTEEELAALLLQATEVDGEGGLFMEETEN